MGLLRDAIDLPNVSNNDNIIHVHQQTTDFSEILEDQGHDALEHPVTFAIPRVNTLNLYLSLCITKAILSFSFYAMRIYQYSFVRHTP